eukprot:6207282-Pleurochrysis_carterae.AAC.2
MHDIAHRKPAQYHYFAWCMHIHNITSRACNRRRRLQAVLLERAARSWLDDGAREAAQRAAVDQPESRRAAVGERVHQRGDAERVLGCAGRVEQHEKLW